MKYSTKLLASVGLGALMALPVAIPVNAAVSEIVVTARKRQENLQDVPLSVTAFTGESLTRKNIVNFQEVAKLTAGFEFDQNLDRTFERPVIRGQSSVLGSSPVSTFINGVYFNGALNTLDLSEAERVEILKGPQTAQFGRNTYGGAISIITRLPGDEFHFKASAQVAEHDQTEFTLGLSGPIVPGKLAVGVYGRSYEYGGEFRNKFDGRLLGDEQSDSIAATLNFTPTENLRIVARGVYQEDDDGMPAVGLTSPSENNVFFRTDNSEFQYFSGDLTQRGSDMFLGVAEQFGDAGNEIQRLGGSLSVEWDLNEAFTVTSITGYEEIDSENIQDISYQFQGGLAFPFIITFGGPDPVTAVPIAVGLFPPNVGFAQTQTFSEELRLSFDNGDRVRGSLGLFYFKEKNKADGPFDGDLLSKAELDTLYLPVYQRAIDELCATDPTCTSSELIILGSGAPAILGDISGDLSVIDPGFFGSSTENIAIFGGVEFDVTTALTVGIEGRYAEEKKSDFSADFTVFDPALRMVTSTRARSAKFKSFTPRFTVDYRLNDDSMIYGVVARGTKPGGFNGDSATAAGLGTFDEETMWSYEVGTKNTFLGGQLRVNASAYFNQIKDYHLTQAVINPFTLELGAAVVNKGKVDVMGIELETVFTPDAVEGLTLNMNYAYNDSEFTKGDDQNEGRLLDVGDDGIRNCSLGQTPEAILAGDPCISGTNHTAAFGSIKGRRLPLAAKHQLNAGFNLVRPLVGEADWFVGTDVSYISDKFVQVQNLAVIPDATLVNVNFGVSNENFRVTFWGKNVFDEDAISSGTRYIDVSNFFDRAFWVAPRRGSQWGVTVNANF